MGIPEAEELSLLLPSRDRTESHDSDHSSMMLNLTERKRRPVGQPAVDSMVAAAPSSQALPTWNHLSYISKFANSFGSLLNI